MSIRWGLIGTGDVTERKSGPALYQVPRSELIAVTNRTLARAESWATRHGAPRVYASVEELLADQNINAVYIATPPDSHARYTVQAANAGKHVLCEKPMAPTPRDCKQMVKACRDNRVSLAIAYYRRYFPVVQKMKRLLDGGTIGKPLRISATTISQFRADQAEPWRLKADIGGGGFLMDVGTHRFDLFAYFFGAAKRVRGITGTQSLPTKVEDAASAALEFTGGVQGTAAFHWNCPIHRDTLEIVGTEGILSTDDLSSSGRLTLETPAGKEFWQLPASAPVHFNLVEKYVSHMLDGQPNPCSGESGMLATEMVAGVYEDASAMG